MVKVFFLIRTEPTKRRINKLFHEKILSCENVVPEYADLQIPGVRDSDGAVDLLDNLLCLVRSVVDIELGGNLSAILHVLPVVNVKL